MDNAHLPDSSKEKLTDPVFGEVISTYTQDQAIDDGFLVFTGNWGDERVLFTSALFAQGYEDAEKRTRLIELGLKHLRQPDKEDTAEMRLRVIEKNKIWVIWNPGYGVTFLQPEDY